MTCISRPSVRRLCLVFTMMAIAAARADAAIGDGYLLSPVNNSTVNATFTLTGISDDAGSGAADAIHIWAFPADGSAPVFLAAVTTFTADPKCDVVHPNCAFTPTIS